MNALLNAEQVAEILGVSERYVWRLGRDGALPRIAIGRRIVFDPADVQAFIDERRSGRRARSVHIVTPTAGRRTRRRERTRL